MIEFKNVSKIYENGTEALKDINLNINQGEFVFMVGASGAGKSTFLKLITHEEFPSFGKVIVNNIDVFNLKKNQIPFFRRTMGIVFQDFRIIDKMNVYDNVAFAMRVTGALESQIQERVPYVLNLVGLDSKINSKTTELSGGERQRVGLARALVNNPSLIIADEPTGNVDPSLSCEIVELLDKINSQGTTVLMVTHEHSLVNKFKKRVIQLENGKIKSDSTWG